MLYTLVVLVRLCNPSNSECQEVEIIKSDDPSYDASFCSGNLMAPQIALAHFFDINEHYRTWRIARHPYCNWRVMEAKT